MKRFAAVLLLLAVIFGLCACAQKNGTPLREEDIRAICSLATLECFYNNVAKIHKKADNIFQKDRTMWIEYEGKATIGVDMSEVIINISGNTVNITMPAAKVLSIDFTINEEDYVVSVDGWLWPNKITAQDQQAAVDEGQKAMKEAIESSKELFLKAETRAKELIENYIQKLSSVVNQEYTIVWNK